MAHASQQTELSGNELFETKAVSLEHAFTKLLQGSVVLFLFNLCSHLLSLSVFFCSAASFGCICHDVLTASRELCRHVEILTSLKYFALGKLQNYICCNMKTYTMLGTLVILHEGSLDACICRHAFSCVICF